MKNYIIELTEEEAKLFYDFLVNTAQEDEDHPDWVDTVLEQLGRQLPAGPLDYIVN